MQHRTFCILAIAVSTAACAPIPAAQASNWQVCEYMMDGGQNAQVAQAEARRRNLDCTRYYPAIVQHRQADDAAAAAIVRSTPAPAAMPQAPINCTSSRSGATVTTSCY